MKKTVLIIMTLTIFAALSAVFSAESRYIRGDADGDGDVTVIDATVIQRRVTNISVPYIDEKAADVDENGLSISDATLIQRMLIGIKVPYNIGEEVIIQDPEPTSESSDDLPFVPDD